MPISKIGTNGLGDVADINSTTTLSFDTAGVERMRISSSGGVSIGTTTDAGAQNVLTQGVVTANGFVVNGNNGIKVNSLNNPPLQLVSNQPDAFSCSMVNNWANGANTGVLVGTSESGGVALQVSRAIPITGGYPSGAGTSVMRVNADGNLQFNSGFGSVATAYGCRAWVNFNGTGTVAIRASGNVSSITDNGTGDYTVNFTNAMTDANFAGVVSASGPVATQHNVTFLGAPGSNDASSHPNSSSFRFSTYLVSNSATRADGAMYNAAIFR